MFGIGDGEIKIIPDKQPYPADEPMKGKVVLKINNPIKARGVWIRLYCASCDLITGRPARRIPPVIYGEAKLDGEHDYGRGTAEYPFQIQITNEKFASAVAGTTASIMNVKWFLEAYLDPSLGFDIKEVQEIKFDK